MHVHQIDKDDEDANEDAGLGEQVDNLIEQSNQNKKKQKQKSVFIIIFWSGTHIKDKLHKICDSFSCNRYEVPHYS